MRIVIHEIYFGELCALCVFVVLFFFLRQVSTLTIKCANVRLHLCVQMVFKSRNCPI